MDQLPRPHVDQPLTPHELRETCPYCGAALHPLLYFCPACSTPYKSPETIITPYIPRQLTGEELVERDAPHVKTLFFTYLGVIIGAAIVSYLLLGKSRYDLHLLINDSAICVTTCIVGVIYRATLAAQFRRIGFDKPEAWIGLLLLIPTLGLNYLYHEVFVKSIAPKEMMDAMDELRKDVTSELAIIVAFCIVPAITEEIAYRGLVQHWLQAAISPWKAMVVAAFLFAFTHLALVSLPYLFLVGMLLGWTKWRTGSLYPSMLIHFLHNFIVIEYFN